MYNIDAIIDNEKKFFKFIEGGRSVSGGACNASLETISAYIQVHLLEGGKYIVETIYSKPNCRLCQIWVFKGASYHENI